MNDFVLIFCHLKGPFPLLALSCCGYTPIALVSQVRFLYVLNRKTALLQYYRHDNEIWSLSFCDEIIPFEKLIVIDICDMLYNSRGSFYL